MDRQSVYSTHTYASNFDDSTDTRIQLQAQLEAFVLGFRLDNNYVYRFVTSRSPLIMIPFDVYTLLEIS